MKTKYLYCKHIYFKGLFATGKWLRFTDIAEYAKRENQVIRDHESERAFEFTSKTFKRVTVDGDILTRNDFKKITFTLPTRRCHVLCLSNKKNDNELFNRFNADICIEINIEELINILNKTFKGSVEIINKDVEYFDTDTGRGGNPTELVFMKHTLFKIENEYRVAIFYPFDERSVIIDKDNKKIEIFGSNGYFGLGINDMVTLNKIIIGVTQKSYNQTLDRNEYRKTLFLTDCDL